MLSKLGIKKAKNKYGFDRDVTQSTEHEFTDSNLKHTSSSASSTNAHFLTTHNYLQPPPPASNQYSQLLSSSSTISNSINTINKSTVSLHHSNSIHLSRKPTKRDEKLVRF